jgi:shikimate dehydrogenase
VTSGADRFLVGLIGASVGVSLSPPLHEQEADELGLRYLYHLIDIDSLRLPAGDVGELVACAQRLGFTGLNITHPCKQTVVPSLNELSREAAAVGAVNTVVFDGERSVGHNTDWSGFVDGFIRGLPDAPLGDVVLLGAGGAGAAVAHAMLTLGVRRLAVLDLDRGRADRLVGALRRAHRAGGPWTVTADGVGSLPERLRAADGLINATPVGMTPRLGSPVPAELLRPELWVADVVYRPLETELLRNARDRGCPTLSGGGMVVFQAAAAFRLFTGREPDSERMYRHFQSLTSAAPVR